MTERVGVSRRGVLAGGAALGLGTMMGARAFAAGELSIPYSNKSLDYYFFVIQEEAVKRAVGAAGGKFQATNANFDNTRQLEQWQSLLLSQPSALISDPIDSQAIVSAIRRYNKQKIPVGIIDTPADGGDVAITVSFDNFKGGVMAAEQIVERLVAKHGSPKGVVLNCYGALASVAWRLRKEGMDSVFAKYPEITYLARPTEGQLEQMLSVTLSTLSEYPNLDAVHAPSDSPSRGIVTALQQKDRWKKVGEEGHVIFVNIDGTHMCWSREHRAEPSFCVDSGRRLPDPAHAVGKHVGHEDVRQAVFVEVNNLETADAWRGSGRKTNGYRRQEIDLLSNGGFGRAFFRLRFASALKKMFEHLTDRGAGLVCLVEQYEQRDAEQDEGDLQAWRQHGSLLAG